MYMEQAEVYKSLLVRLRIALLPMPLAFSSFLDEPQASLVLCI
jgi:hypothetical protein